MAVFGLICGAGLNDDRATGCFTGMMGSCKVKGVVAGLAHWPEPPPPPHPQALRPFLAARYPVPESSPNLIRLRRCIRPALISSCRFLNALYISLNRALDTFSPRLLKYMTSSYMPAGPSARVRKIRPDFARCPTIRSASQAEWGAARAAR